MSTDSMIEIDFTTSNAAPVDTASDDSFVPIEMDGPIAMPEALPAVTTEVTAEAPSQASDVMSALADIASFTVGNTSGSLLDGTMRGVGFSNAEGYVTALANGTKQATADQYLDTLRRTYHYTPEQIAALTVSIIPEATASTGALLADGGPSVVRHDGPNIFEQRRIERGLAANARVAPSAVRPMPGTSPATPVDDTVILPALAAATVAPIERTCGLKLAWCPAGRTGFTLARAFLVDTLASAGLADLAPGIPAEKGQFGKIMKSFNSMDARDARGEDSRLMASCVTRRNYDKLGLPWPTDLESRYIVGHVDASPDLGKLGDKFLVCSLVEVSDNEYEVQFTGGTDALRQAVSAKFENLVGTASMNSTNLLRWYTETLARKFGAIRSGYAMLIVDKGDDASKERIERAQLLADTLQGTDLYGPSPIMGRQLVTERVISREGVTWHAFCIQLGGGMLNDVREHGKVFAKEYAAAQEHARKQESNRHDATPETIEMAVRRAQIGSDRANNKALALLNTLKALQTRAVALIEVIGREHARPAIDACEALRVEWAPKCKGIDATSEMAANIELD